MDFDISFSRYRFLIEAVDQIQLGKSYWGNVLRGSLLSTWKPAACKVMPGQMGGQCSFGSGKSIEHCSEKPSCSFGQVLDSPLPPNADRDLIGNTEIPRPYAFLPQRALRPVLEPGDLAAFDLLLVGSARRYIREFCAAFILGQEKGIGVGRGRYKLHEVTSIDLEDCAKEILYSGVFTNKESVCFTWKEVCDWSIARYGGTNRVTVNFNSLTGIKQKPVKGLSKAYAEHSPSGLVAPRDFFEFFRAVFRVTRHLAFLYCDQPALDEVFRRSLEDLSAQIETVSEDLHQVELYRKSEDKSSHQQDPNPPRPKRDLWYPVKGYTGWVVYQGDLDPFIPWLTLGQFLHIGEFRVEGLGSYRLTT
ncbi:MAG: CRISPR system precrRNA processing endoribonuclease RAMP protein Cas6 [Candidatus Latescibacteria bacterium]|nr:CRISPR system precrRNA processing endoribonuclease RAMP protein Cas6 [Candidatus Latescibacterota bacterium]